MPVTGIVSPPVSHVPGGDEGPTSSLPPQGVPKTRPDDLFPPLGLASVDKSGGLGLSFSSPKFQDELTIEEDVSVEDAAIQNVSLSYNWYWDELNKRRDENVQQLQLENLSIGTTVSVVSALSVGYVLWTMRTGYLLAGLIATLPAWQTIDPLSVLQSFAAPPRDDEDEEDAADKGLSSMIQNGTQSRELAESPPAKQDRPDHERHGL